MLLTRENIRLFWKLFARSYKESSHEESKTFPFPNLCPSYLKYKLQIHLVSPTSPSFARSLKYKIRYPKMLDIIEFMR